LDNKKQLGQKMGDTGYAKIARPSSLTGKSETMAYLIDDIESLVTQNQRKKK
jgi:hypothetical protein